MTAGWDEGDDAIPDRAIQILETSHPPTYYLPREAFAPGVLQPAQGTSWCEFKGTAGYLDVVAGDVTAPSAAWY